MHILADRVIVAGTVLVEPFDLSLLRSGFCESSSKPGMKDDEVVQGVVLWVGWTEAVTGSTWENWTCWERDGEVGLGAWLGSLSPSWHCFKGSGVASGEGAGPVAVARREQLGN